MGKYGYDWVVTIERSDGTVKVVYPVDDDELEYRVDDALREARRQQDTNYGNGAKI